MNILLLTLLVLAALLVSGCTINPALSPATPATTRSGVIIERFGPVFHEIQSEEPVTFRLSVRNAGSVDATDVHAELLGLDQAWCENTRCQTSAGGFAEKLPEEEECRYTGQGFNLKAPDPTLGSPGETRECTWKYVAPTLDRDLKVTYDATARVFYTYQSSTVESVIIGSIDELKRVQDSGGTIPSQTVSKSVSPIEISVAIQSPVRSWKNSATFPVKITVQNIGGGFACARNSGPMKDACKKTSPEYEKNRDRVLLKITGNNLELSDDCTGFENGEPFSLARGISNSFLCDITATGLNQGLVERTLTVTATYEYATDSQATITVAGLGYRV